MTFQPKHGLVKTAALSLAALALSSHAYAADKELLDILLKNGSIDSKQYDALLKKGDLSAKDAKSVGVNTTLDNKGLKFETADNNFSFRFNGRLHADAMFHGNDGDMIAKDGKDTEANDGAHIRRARLEAAGTFYKNWDWRMQYEWAKNKSDEPHWRDMWIRYSGWDLGRITAGHQKRPFSLQEMMSSNDMVFAERSFEYAFIAPLERAVGLGFDTNGHNWTAAVGVFGDDLKSDQKTTEYEIDPKTGTVKAHTVGKADQGWSAAGRLTYAPIADEHTAVHLGVSGAYTKIQDSANDPYSVATFKVEPTSDISDFRILEAKIGNVSNYANVGAEAAAVYGPFSMEGEYVRSYIDQNKAGTIQFDGWHVDAQYSLTGETRHYEASKGVFGRLKPNHNFDLNGGWGAWELKARLHSIDMNDIGEASKGKKFGRATAATFGINWYLNQNVRLMADYSHMLDVDAGTDAKGKGDGNDLDYMQLRASLAF